MPKIGLVGASKKAADVKDPEPEHAVPAVEAEHHHHDELDRLRGIIFGSLQTDQEKALARLENRIAAQSAKVRGELDEIVRRLENRIEELDARSSKDQDDLREQLLSQSNLLNDAIEERSAQVSQLVNEGLRDLAHAKLDRQRFSSFLVNLKAHLDQAEEAPVHEESATAEPEETQENSNGIKQNRPPWHPVR